MHDSHLFDGVDVRQFALALQAGSAAADELIVQYVVTMNSDLFASLPFSSDFRIDGKLLPEKFNDTNGRRC